jgi:Ribbon-helix-helix protein, copG family.
MSKSESRQRESRIEIRCSQEEANAIREKAKAAGISTSELLRRAAIGITVKSPVVTLNETKMINELLRLGGLQKHLHNRLRDQMTPELSNELSQVNREIKTAIVAIRLRQVSGSCGDDQ